MFKHLTATVTVTALLLAPGSAAAFTEDLCFIESAAGTTVENCYTPPKHLSCEPGNTSTVCQTANVPDVAAMLSGNGRSMVHVDATYVLAQLAGFTADEAHLMAAYNQAADVAPYVPYDRTGSPVVTPCECDGSFDPVECKYLSIDISALSRLDFDSGGSMIHYMAPHNHGGTGGDALAIDPENLDPVQEEMLLGWRTWATYQTDACTLGLLSPQGCYGSTSPTAKVITGSAPLLAVLGSVPVLVELGEQVFRWNHTGDLTGSGFDDAVGDPVASAPGDDAWLARFGLYLHFLQDRISHNRCSDAPNTEITGPSAAGHYQIVYDSDECAAPIHGLRHSWEVGRNLPQSLDARDRTAEHALRLTYDELKLFATQHGRTPMTLDENSVIAALTTALQTPGALDRLAAMDAAALSWGVDPMPY